MSGNPFRRARSAQHSEDPPSRNDSPSAPSPKLEKKKTKKKKVVKIQTPPHSPEEVSRRLSIGRTSPPLPPALLTPAAAKEDEEFDSSPTVEPELDEATRNTRRNSGSLASPAPPPGSGAPYNPFARTLATVESSTGLKQTKLQREKETGEDGRDQQHSGVGPTAMDVDAFKNMLLNGSSTPSETPATLVTRSVSEGKTSAATNRSSFDPMRDFHLQSPRTSLDRSDSDSMGSDDDEEKSNLMRGGSRMDDLAPPAPPKGNSSSGLSLRGPQTVSFADFDESINTEFSSSSNPPTNARSDSYETSRPRVLQRLPSDLNKPLPLPPEGLNTSAIASLSTPQPSFIPAENELPSSAQREDVSTPKKAPPPPPASRRQAQAQGLGRPRSSSNLTQDSAPDDNSAASKGNDPTTKAVPPPPPSRKARPPSHSSSPGVETPQKDSSPPPSDHKAMPPPPPRRAPSKAHRPLHHMPTNNTHSGISRSASKTAPAPPPRRGGGNSSRSSVDPHAGSSLAWALDGSRRRGSNDSSESGRLTPGSAHNQVPGADGATSNDVLADMSAFQAEIDALRARSANNG